MKHIINLIPYLPMANWLTIKQLSAKRGLTESTLRNWTNLGYITSATIDGIIMLDDDSLTSYLNVHQTKGLNKESLEKLIKGKESEYEIVLSQLDDELFLLKTQKLHQPLFHIIIKELGQLITDASQREIFLSISCGEPISRVAVRHNMTYQDTINTYSELLINLSKNTERIATFRDRAMTSLFGKYNTDDPTNIPLRRMISDRACNALFKLNIHTVHQLLQYTAQNGWPRLKRLEGLGEITYNEIINALYNANFIVFHENKSIGLSPEISALIL